MDLAAPARTLVLLLGAGLLGAGLLGGCTDPSPPHLDPVAGRCATASCHAGIEQIHYGGNPLTCVDCHLGDAEALTKEAAHVTVDVSLNASTPGSAYLDSPAMAELDALPEDVVQFLNPSDYRVVRKTCGSSILGGGNCHTAITEASLLLGRATLAGTFAGGGYAAGIQDKEPLYSVVDAHDPWVPRVLPPGTVQSLQSLPEGPPEELAEARARAFFPVFEQICIECHLYQDGPKIPGRYYSSGCNSCHMLTGEDPRAKTADATQDRSELGHVLTHRFTNEIPDSQCAMCHISHLGRSLLSRGVRERSEAEGDTLMGGVHHGVEDPEHAVPWAEDNYVPFQGGRWLYGKPYPYFLEDEDGTNEVDETPPDVHSELGLACIDCHNIREAHGDKAMQGHMDQELDVRCASCHGRPGAEGSLESDAGLAFTKSGTTVGGRGENLTIFSELPDGRLVQTGKLDGAPHPVTQITRRTEATRPPCDLDAPRTDEDCYNPRTRMGCELHAGSAEVKAKLKTELNALAAEDPAAVAEAFPGAPAGFHFEDHDPTTEPDGRVACFTCHNTWTVNCYGCHIVRDDRETYRSRMSGELAQGKVSTFGLSVLADALALGFNSRGRITPLVGTTNFFTHIGAGGETLIDAAPQRSYDGLEGDGNVQSPVHHHTVRRQPRDCDGCHPSATGSHDVAALLRAVGLGTDEHVFVDGQGREHRLDRLVLADYDGDGVPEDPVANDLPAAVVSVEPLAGSSHVSLPSTPEGTEPGPLDAVTITRLLSNPVVPQRPKEARPP